MRYRLITILAAIILIVAAATAIQCSNKPADTGESFGVGARADAMGDAFVAIADDATATFWNPAGLSLLPGRQVTSITKALPMTTEYIKSTLAVGQPFPEFGGVITSDSASAGTDSTDVTFYSLNMPLEKNGRRLGMLGISHSIVGYFDRALTLDEIVPAGTGLNRAVSSVRDRGQVEHTTLAYAWQPTGQIRYGLGLVQATMTASVYGSDQLYFDDPANDVTFPMARLETSGKGYGYILGSLWNPKSKSGKWTVGGTYLSKITVQDFDSQAFGDERPDRFLLGTSYVAKVQGSKTNDQYTWALQLSRLGSANEDMGGFARRNAIWNLNLGGEYETHRGNYSYPIRYGMFTNKSPNKAAYGYENWLTFGLGAGRSDKSWQSELAVQYGMSSKLSLVSLSGNYYIK